MGKCQANNGNNKRWESTLGGVTNEGLIRIDEEVQGAFNGRHEGLNMNLSGSCRESNVQKDKIIFRVGSRFLYVGVFTSGTKIEGFKLDLDQLCSAENRKKKELTGDDDWVAVKVT